MKTPLLIRLEKYDHVWLHKEAKKRHISIAELIRNIIFHFKKLLKTEEDK